MSLHKVNLFRSVIISFNAVLGCVCVCVCVCAFCQIDLLLYLIRNIRNEFYLAREHGYFHEGNLYNFNWLPDLLAFLDSELNRSCEFWYGIFQSGSPPPTLTQEPVDQRDLRMLQRWGIWKLNGPSPDDWARREGIRKLRGYSGGTGTLKVQRDQPSRPFTIVERTGDFPEPPPPPQSACPVQFGKAARQAQQALQSLPNHSRITFDM